MELETSSGLPDYGDYSLLHTASHSESMICLLWLTKLKEQTAESSKCALFLDNRSIRIHAASAHLPDQHLEITSLAVASLGKDLSPATQVRALGNWLPLRQAFQIEALTP